MADTPTLVRFVPGFAEDGVDDGGMPVFRETIDIILERPPYIKITREATEEDFDNYTEPFRLFNKEQAARKATHEGKTDGYPLLLWPAISPAELQMCLSRDVTTVQDLAKLAKGNPNMPPNMIEVAKRAAKMVELQGKVGRHAEIITQLTAERDTLAEQLKEANATISAQNAMIEAMKTRVA